MAHDLIKKESPKGVSEMSKIFEDMKEEAIQRVLRSVALRMLQAGKYSLAEISYISGLSLDEVKKLSADRTA